MAAFSSRAAPGQPLDKSMSAPVSLGGLFGRDSDSDSDGDGRSTGFDNTPQESALVLGGVNLRLLERPFHPTNANAVWPGAHVLADWCLDNMDALRGKPILELGSATGAFALFAVTHGLRVTTSDVDDDEVEASIAANFALNGLGPQLPPHWAHTWGTDVPPGMRGAFAYVLASDILLYVHAYDGLVRTLAALCSPWEGRLGAQVIMSWQRRLPESAQFFTMAEKAGFTVEHLGRLVYRLTWKLPDLD
jgi:predicted nicotinamide N-methyase